MTSRLRRWGLVLLAAAAATTAVRGQDRRPEDAVGAAVDRVFADVARPGAPGCSVWASRGGAIVLERGYGAASLEHAVGIAPATRFHAASITKQFTAMSVLLLAKDGRLSLDDDVRRHVPEWSVPERVTIRHLLTHTSGLRDAFLLTELTSPRDGPVTDRLIGLLARQRGLVFAPGTASEYNNGAYLLLGDIVRRISGQSLRAFMAARIFGPLGMSDTHLHDDPFERVPRLAIGYTPGGDGFRLTRPQGDVVGNAGLVTTARDLLIWERNFVEPRVGDAAIVAAMQTPAVLAGGTKTAFGMGLQILMDRGRRTFAHGGGDPGISAYVARYPDHDLAVAVLCNSDGIDATALTRGVVDAYLGPAASAAAAGPAATAPPPPAQLAAHVGLYLEPREDALLRIFVRDGALRGSSGAGEGDEGWPLTPLGGDRFVIPGTEIVLEFSGDAARHRLRIVGERPTPDVLARVAPLGVAAPALAAYAGRFASGELDIAYDVSARTGTLVLQMPGRAAIALQPIAPDLFAGPLVGAIRFTRDGAGRPTGFAIRAHGALGVRFERVAAR